MTVQQSKRRPLSRYLKDFKHSQTHCTHCRKLLDRITLVRSGQIVNKLEIARLDTPMDESGRKNNNNGLRCAVFVVICIAKLTMISSILWVLINF